MEKFNGKIFNPQVFEKYLKTLESTKENALIKSAVFKPVSKYASKLSEQAGGNYTIEPIKGRIGGEAQNYDGKTDIKSNSRKTFYQGKIAIGRDNAWGEDDFTNEITSTNFMPEANEVKEYWDEQHQGLALSILKGIFNMTGSNGFVEKHTYEISGNLDADGCNKASQKAMGDKKAKLTTLFTHSVPATNLEGLNLINFLKYTDKDGIERDLTIGTYNGKLVIVDDDMPVLNGYDSATESTTGALKVVTTGATDGQILLSDVKKGDFYPANVAANDYVIVGTKYISYLMSNGYFEFEKVPVKVPSEIDRDAKSKGGHTDLISRERVVIVPDGISFTKKSMATLSPTNAELENGTNWELCNDDGETKEYINDKLVPLARIISRG